MLGAIIGDTVGSVYEFDNTKDYNFPLFTRETAYTDDSILTLAVAEWGLAGEPYSSEALVDSLVRFGRNYPCPMGGYGGGFSIWLFHPEQLTDYRTGRRLPGRSPYHSCGNGSAMRVSAVGWLFDSLEKTEEIAAVSAAVTHDHPEGIKGAQAVAGAVWMARSGYGKEEIRTYLETRYGYDMDMGWEDLHRHYTWDSTCQGTVPEAMVAFLESTDFEDAVRKAVSMGGDSDTLACITGAVAEAFYGEIPAEMTARTLELLPEDLRRVLAGLGAGGAYRKNYLSYVRPYIGLEDGTLPATPRRLEEFTPDRIVSLRPGEIFVFGSNLAGRHGGGAARLAYERFGAEWGKGVGMAGQTYAIPTMQGGVETIRPYVDAFIAFAREHLEYRFLVTRIGCGIAGFADEEIAPLFAGARELSNVLLPRTFHEVLDRRC